MDAIEAGKICRDAGFNWGRGSWWVLIDGSNSVVSRWDFDEDEDLSATVPDVTKCATLGVILGWAREMTGQTITIEQGLTFDGFYPWSRQSGQIAGISETEIECYAKLCQSVKQEQL